MNKNIKQFRVWSKVEKKFVYNRLIDDNFRVYDWVGGYGDRIEVEPAFLQWPDSDGSSMYIIQRFTGALDSKGEPIYEGDMVYYRFGHEHAAAEEACGEVFYDKESAAFLFDRSYQFGWNDAAVYVDSIKVVGNILELDHTAEFLDEKTGKGVEFCKEFLMEDPFRETKVEDYEENYNKFWREIVQNPDGSINLDQVKRELFDFYRVMQNAAEVYCEITGNRVSKPLTDVNVILGLWEEGIQKRIEEEIQDQIKCGILKKVDD